MYKILRANGIVWTVVDIFGEEDGGRAVPHTV